MEKAEHHAWNTVGIQYMYCSDFSFFPLAQPCLQSHSFLQQYLLRACCVSGCRDATEHATHKVLPPLLSPRPDV